jgi:hypothetical protein
MNEEILKKIAETLDRIAVCMENKQARDVAENKKKLQESKKPSTK